MLLFVTLLPRRALRQKEPASHPAHMHPGQLDSQVALAAEEAGCFPQGMPLQKVAAPWFQSIFEFRRLIIYLPAEVSGICSSSLVNMISMLRSDRMCELSDK